MAVRDLLRPVDFHNPGFSPQQMAFIRNMGVRSTPKLVKRVRHEYDRLLELINRGLAGQGVDTEDEQVAADMVAHLMIDAAILHNSLKAAQVLGTGDFPYDWAVDIILPRKQTAPGPGPEVLQ